MAPVLMRRGMAKVAAFKKVVEVRPADHKLGLAQLIVCSDAADCAADLACWLNSKSREKNFSFVSMVGPATTREAVASMNTYGA
jgi:hypothetical protein